MVDQLDVPDVARALGIFNQQQDTQRDTANRNALLDLRRQGVDLQRAGLDLRREDMGLRRDAASRAQSNADRLFGLNLRKFEQDRAEADRRFGLDSRTLDFKTQKLASDAKKGTPTFQNYQRAVEDGFEGSFFDYQRQLAEAKSQGKVFGKSGAESIVAAPAAIDKAQDALTVIQQLRDHPSREAATGFQSFFPTAPGSGVSDFESDSGSSEGSSLPRCFRGAEGWRAHHRN